MSSHSISLPSDNSPPNMSFLSLLKSDKNSGITLTGLDPDLPLHSNPLSPRQFIVEDDGSGMSGSIVTSEALAELLLEKELMELKKDGIATASKSTTTRSKNTSKEVRHKKMTTWLQLLSLILIWTLLIELVERLHWEKDEIFSMDLLKPWLCPILLVEVVLTALSICIIMLKMKILEDPTVNTYFQSIMTFNNFQYLMVMLLIPIGIYCSLLTELSVKMKEGLDHDIILGKGAGMSWRMTQMERHCCGYDDRLDWRATKRNYAMAHWRHLAGEKIYLDLVYPTSCCNLEELQKGSRCIEGDRAYWPEGCYARECEALYEYAGLTVGLLFLAFILTVNIQWKVKKLERFMVIFRPLELF